MVEFQCTAVRGSEDRTALPNAVRLVLGHAALKPERVAAVREKRV